MRRPGSGQSIVRSVRFGARLRSAVPNDRRRTFGFRCRFLSVRSCVLPVPSEIRRFPANYGKSSSTGKFPAKRFLHVGFSVTCNCAATGDRRGATTRRKMKTTYVPFRNFVLRTPLFPLGARAGRRTGIPHSARPSFWHRPSCTEAAPRTIRKTDQVRPLRAQIPSPGQDALHAVRAVRRVQRGPDRGPHDGRAAARGARAALHPTRHAVPVRADSGDRANARSARPNRLLSERQPLRDRRQNTAMSSTAT